VLVAACYLTNKDPVLYWPAYRTVTNTELWYQKFY